MGFGLVGEDFGESSRKQGFALDWVLSGSWGDYMIYYHHNTVWEEGRL